NLRPRRHERDGGGAFPVVRTAPPTGGARALSCAPGPRSHGERAAQGDRCPEGRAARSQEASVLSAPGRRSDMASVPAANRARRTVRRRSTLVRECERLPELRGGGGCLRSCGRGAWKGKGR